MKNFILILFTFAFIWGVQAQLSENITFQHADKTVNGSFLSPAGGGVYPTIVINAGTGANDRDGTIVMQGANVECLFPELLNQTLKPYRQLSDAMVAAGYAVLIFDKLEYTYPSPADLGPVTFEKLWLPVNSAIGYIKTRSDVDTSNIVLIGHSEGSTIIPYIAKDRTDVKALISIAGPRSPLDSLLAYQLVNIAEVCNGDVPFWQNQANQILGYFDFIRSGNWDSNTPPILGVSANVWSTYMDMADSVSTNYNLANLPTLFIGLEDDMNVPPIELSRLQNEINVTDDFWSIPDLNHYMTPVAEPNISPVLTDTIIYWLSQNVLSTHTDLLEEEFSLDVYPNPFDHEFVISSKNLKSKKWDVSITDGLGREVFRNEIYFDGNNPHLFSTASWASGIYIISFKSETQQFTTKVVKE